MNGSWNAHRENLISIIKEVGWAVVGVFPTTREEVWCAYTVGMTERGLPELVMSGFPGEQARELLNIAATFHIAKEMEPGDSVPDVAVGIDFRVISAPRAPIGQTKLVYGQFVHTHAVQLVWPDDKGAYPGGSYDSKFKQELFGPAWW